MDNTFRYYDRWAFVFLLILTIGSGIWALLCLIGGLPNEAKWVGTAGLLATASGVVQLEVSGLFTRIFEAYVSEEKRPNPSYIVLEIIDNPDRPFRA